MTTVRLTYKNLMQQIISLIILLGLIVFSTSAFAESCKPTNCPTTCSSSSSSNCGKKFDAKCLHDQTEKTPEGSCFNNVPVSGADSVSSGCTSSGTSTESGTNFPVTLSSPSEKIYARAAAKGKVIYAGTTEDGGRTVVIEHTKGCTDSGHGDTGKYHSVYKHLLSINVSEGQEVNMNDPIGIVGGSTATAAGSICDNIGQEGAVTDGCSGTNSDDIHLNFEVFDGPASSSGTAAASSASLDSNCSDIQNFCGSCSSEVNICLSEKPASYRETSETTVNIDLQENTAKISSSAACNLEFKLDPNDCTFCPLFRNIFNAASVIAKTANDGLADPTKKLVGIGFMIWLAIYILRNVASFGAIKISEIMKNIIFQGFRVTVVMLILGGALYQAMDLTINPILKTGLSFSRSFSNISTCPSDARYLRHIIGYDSEKGLQKSSQGGLSKQVGIAFVCSIKRLEDNVSKLMTYGHYSTCLSFKDFATLGFMPHAGFLTTGGFLYIVGVVLMIAFPWFLIDCLLQLCITVALMPCAIGAFAFKITAKYMKTLWDYFMNAMFNFVFIAIIIFIITSNFKTWLGYDFDKNVIDPNLFINATGNGLAWWGTSAFRILGVCFFCFMFLDEAKSMAGKFASAPTLGGGKGIGTMFGGMAASAGFSATKTGAKAAGQFVGATGESIESLFGVSARSMSNQTRGMLAGMTGGQKILDKNGNVIGYERTRRILGHEYKETFTKDKDGIWSSTRSTKDKTTIDDTILATTLRKDNNGNVVGIETKAHNVSSKYLVNKDGTINRTAYDQLMQNAQNKDYAARHIISTVMSQREMSLNDAGLGLDNRFISSDIKQNQDGSWTITQKNEDGRVQTVTAMMTKDNRMVIKSEIKDGNQVIYSRVTDGKDNYRRDDGLRMQYEDLINTQSTGARPTQAPRQATPSQQDTRSTATPSSSADEARRSKYPTSAEQPTGSTETGGAPSQPSTATQPISESRSAAPRPAPEEPRETPPTASNTPTEDSKEKPAESGGSPSQEGVRTSSMYDQTTNTKTQIYQDNSGNTVTVERNEQGDITSIRSASNTGIYTVTSTEFNEERLAEISKKLDQSPANLNGISADITREKQESDRLEEAGVKTLKAQQDSLIRKEKDQGLYTAETYIDSNGNRMTVQRSKETGEISSVTTSMYDEASDRFSSTRVRGNENNNAELEALVERLKNSPNDMSSINDELRAKTGR